MILYLIFYTPCKYVILELFIQQLLFGGHGTRIDIDNSLFFKVPLELKFVFLKSDSFFLDSVPFFLDSDPFFLQCKGFFAPLLFFQILLYVSLFLLCQQIIQCFDAGTLSLFVFLLLLPCRSVHCRHCCMTLFTISSDN